MLKKIFKNIQKKSLKERFLLVLAILFFMFYLVLGLFIIFMKEFPLDMAMGYRIAFGILLIVYSIVRGVRIINEN
ncbi:hypothetical protein [uncultured Flavobacterium sp.]|jgi:uncharacterized membrane protein (DUF485 family)|uniref:hypothetical protein n=1 Tax=uncultured Flavobacterium sp. TaxID=165435 RepID=UPI0030EDCF93|tara:strand:- start:2827 stop:3051 length:225 start_codon:yes stop_codon:yes gene_type:complete